VDYEQATVAVSADGRKEEAWWSVSHPTVERPCSIRTGTLPKLGTRAWRLNRSRSLISARLGRSTLRFRFGVALRMLSVFAIDVLPTKRRRSDAHACLLCPVDNQYVVALVDILSSIDCQTVVTAGDQCVSRITVAAGAGGNIRPASACFHSNR